MRALLAALAGTAAAAALTTALTTGCSAGPAGTDPGPRFDDGGAGDIAYMQHQAATPGPRYTEPGRRRSGEVLSLLRYYTANGAKPYCDGAAPTDADRRWARLYVDLGADRAMVAPLLG